MYTHMNTITYIGLDIQYVSFMPRCTCRCPSYFGIRVLSVPEIMGNNSMLLLHNETYIQLLVDLQLH